MDARFEQAKAHFLEGLAHYQARRFAQAAAAFEASLALVPGRASSLANLGASRLAQGQWEAALDPLAQALMQEPGDADAWGHQATALAELGRMVPALESARRATELAPASGPAWSLLGKLLRELGDAAGAIAAFERAIALGHAPALNAYFVAGLRGDAAPPAPPPEYVQSLFDHYAEGFETHLVDVLRYRAPAVLAARPRARGFATEAALDLGCGTGLVASAFAGLARHFDGVDLSAAMVAQAQASGRYRQVLQADVAGFLAQTGGRWGLVVAADVFIYVGALEAVFAGVARVLSPGGLFCFSVEESTGSPLALLPSLRYAHSEGLIRELADRHGFAAPEFERGPLREDQGVPTPGLFCWLVRSGA